MNKRIQRKRTRGWHMPENTIDVTRPGRWGNPYILIPPEKKSGAWGMKCRLDDGTETTIRAVFADEREARAQAVAWAGAYFGIRGVSALRGHDLACWCKLCEQHQDGKPFDEVCEHCAPCHADVLGALANQ